MPWQPLQVSAMTAPRSALPSRTMGISGGGGLVWARAGALKAQERTTAATAFERNTGRSSWEIPFSTARILAKTRGRWQATGITPAGGTAGQWDLYDYGPAGLGALKRWQATWRGPPPSAMAFSC